MAEARINQHLRTVDKKEPLSRLAGWLRHESNDVPVIMDGKKPYGIVDARQLSGRGVRAGTNAKRAAQPVPILSEDASDHDILSHISQTLASYLPVANAHGKLVGTLSASDALDFIVKGPTAAHAAEVVPLLSPTHTLDHAAHVFGKIHSDWLPIQAKGQVVGVLERSVLMRMQGITDQPDGQLDRRGEPAKVREQEISGYMDEGWSQCDALASFDEIRAIVKKSGYAFVMHNKECLGVATAPFLARAAELNPS